MHDVYIECIFALIPHVLLLTTNIKMQAKTCKDKATNIAYEQYLDSYRLQLQAKENELDAKDRRIQESYERVSAWFDMLGIDKKVVDFRSNKSNIVSKEVGHKVLPTE